MKLRWQLRRHSWTHQSPPVGPSRASHAPFLRGPTGRSSLYCRARVSSPPVRFSVQGPPVAATSPSSSPLFTHLPVWPSPRPWPSPRKLPERVCWGRGGEAGARVSTNVFLRDLDLWGINVQDPRRIEVIAEGLPAFHGAQLAIDATLVSPLRADGAPHRRCADESGAALVAARRRKDRTYPELSGERGRAKLVVLAGEIGGFLRTLATTQVRRSRARQSWMHRWGSMLACAAARAFASSLLDRQGHPGVDGDTPAVPDVFGDFCRAPPSAA